MQDFTEQLTRHVEADVPQAARPVWSFLVIAVALLIVALMLVTSGLILWNGRGVAEEVWRQELGNEALTRAHHASQTLVAADLVLHSVADMLADTDAASAADVHAALGRRAVHDLLKDRTRGVPQVDVVTVVDLDGNFASSTRRFPVAAQNVVDRPYFRAQVDDPALELYLEPPTRNRLTGEWMLFLSRKIRNRAGLVIGVAVVGVPTRFFSEFYRKTASDEHVQTTLSRSDGTLFARYPGDDAYDGESSVQPASPASVQGEGGAWQVDPAGARRLVLRSPVPGFPLVVTASAPEHLVFARWRERAGVLAGTLAFNVLLILLLAAWITRLMRRQAATLLSLHDTRSQAAEARRALQLSDTREALLRRDAAVKTRVVAFDGELRQSMERLGDTISQYTRLAERMTEAARAAQRGGESVEGASTSAAQHVASVAQNAEKISSAGQDIASRTADSVGIVDDVMQEADRTDLAIHMLSDATRQIDHVSGLISQVASQTNLLALNATIEAARAGEAGRGFAVVASEIKSLAAQTTGATAEISRQVTAIREAGESCIAALESIRTRMLDTRSIGESIAERVAGQSRSVDEIARTIREAADDAMGVLAGARAVREAADMSHGSAEEVASLAIRLQSEARRIGEQIEAFFRTLDAA